jgi:hypothetical protein
MPAGKIVNLCVRPQQAANLALPVAGIVQDVPVTLGQQVVEFDFKAFYGGLGAHTAADPAVLEFDSGTIEAAPPVAASTVLYLRAESTKAVLDSAIAARANAYYGRYGNQAGIVAQVKALYEAANAGSKSKRLDLLKEIAQTEANMLHAAYTPGRLGVVKTTTSELSSQTNSTGKTATTSTGTSKGKSSGKATEKGTTSSASVSVTGQEGSIGDEGTITAGQTKSTTVDNTGTTASTQASSALKGTTKSSGTTSQQQLMTNTDYGYRVPDLEREAVNQRAQVSLMDEWFADFMRGQNIPDLGKVLTNELEIIDLTVKRLQVGYLDTILLSPIGGVVTAVAKNAGDGVAAGEVVARVEKWESVYLVGTVIYRGTITVGVSTAKVRTTKFGDPSNTTTIKGLIVAAQGHESGDDRWDIVISCNNRDSAGNEILPLHYGFDYDDTTIVIA